MVDLPALVRLRPEYAVFNNQRNLVNRGDIVAFRPNIRTEFFSTDALGFRHSTFDGETLGVADVLKRDRYGLVLGSSHIFGVGLAGNEHTLSSLLAERFGIPFANASLPEGNSRNLCSLLTAYAARAPRPPAVVVHFSGGDFTSYCLSGMADAVFGSPNLKQLDDGKGVAAPPPATQTITAVLRFTTLWTRSIISLCQARAIPIVLGHDTTFFEKAAQPNEHERRCELGSPSNALQRRWFPTHKAHFPEFLARREAMAANLSVPLAGPGRRNELSFIDEFHYDRDGTRALCDDVAKEVGPLLGST
jgi:lysophospholipase L1-like esterase